MLSPAMVQPPWRHAGRQLSVSDMRRVQAMTEAGYAKALRQHASGEAQRAHREAQLEQQVRDLERLGMRYQADIDALKVEVNALVRWRRVIPSPNTCRACCARVLSARPQG